MAAIYLNAGALIDADGNDVEGQVFSYEFATEDFSDAPTFGEVKSGDKQWILNMTITQDAATDTLFDYLWNHTGETIPINVAPYGNAAPSATEPHYACNAKIEYPDGTVLGGEATRDRNRGQVEVSWKLDAKPTVVTVPAGLDADATPDASDAEADAGPRAGSRAGSRAGAAPAVTPA